MSSNIEREMEAHGTALDPEKKRVRCHYCGQEVGGFIRLRHHLCGVALSDVTPCMKVPNNVKIFLTHRLEEHRELPLKRSSSSQSSEARRCQPRPTDQASPSALFTGGLMDMTSSGNRSKGVDAAGYPNILFPPWLVNEWSKNPNYHAPPHLAHLFSSPSDRTFRGESSRAPRYTLVLEPRSVESISGRGTDQTTLIGAKPGTSSSPAARCIGRFFFEAGIDPAMAKLPSFRKMIESIAVSRSGYNDVVVPSCDDLNGWILRDEVNEVTERVEDIKRTWSLTGCSILLDSWKDQRGRSFINFLVDCPRGTLFWKSADVSAVVNDAHTLFLLIDVIIKDVGEKHVVQIISDDGSDAIESVGELVMNKYRYIFWTLCADLCIDLILQKIQTLPHVRRLLEQAKIITRFMYNDESTIDLMRRQMPGRHVVQTSALKSAASFLTVRNMVLQREGILKIFGSLTSTSASTSSPVRENGRAAAVRLVNDVEFWSGARDVLKLTDPLLGILNEISRDDRRAMGILYEAFDQAKEAIRSNVGGESERYEEVWGMVDDVWSDHLHSPLHAFGYYLNPAIFYYNLHCDSEIASGLTYSISRMAENQRQHDLLTIQLDVYGGARGRFGEDAAVDQRKKVSPDVWWSRYAGHCPELQRVAVRVLSQRCSVSPKYRLRRSATERFQEDGQNAIEQQRLLDVEFVHNNRCLWQSSTNEPPAAAAAAGPSSSAAAAGSSAGAESSIIYCHESVDPCSEWVVDDSSPFA